MAKCKTLTGSAVKGLMWTTVYGQSEVTTEIDVDQNCLNGSV